MEIKTDVRDNILEFIIKKNLEETLKELPDKGTYSTECDYQLAFNEKYPKLFFVISLKMTYHNHSLDSKKYGLYAFDSTDGHYVPDFEKENGCYNGFFTDLKIIERII